MTEDSFSFYCPYWTHAEPTDKHPCKNIRTNDSKCMLRHILRKHVRNLQCEICGIRFGGQHEFTRHKTNKPRSCKPKAFEPVPQVAIDLEKELRRCRGEFDSVLYPWATQRNWQTRYDFQDTNKNPTPSGSSDSTEQNEAGYNSQGYNPGVKFINEDMMQETDRGLELEQRLELLELDEEWRLERSPEFEGGGWELDVPDNAFARNMNFGITMSVVESPTDEELQPMIVDYPTGFEPPSSPHYDFYENVW